MTPSSRPTPTRRIGGTAGTGTASTGASTAADALRAAGIARTLLADPGAVELAVDGPDPEEDVLGDLAADGLAMSDHDGVPLFAVPTECRLVAAARDHRRAVLTVRADDVATGRAPAAPRAAGLRLAGWLSPHEHVRCACCAQERATLVLVVDLVMLLHDDGTHTTVPVRAFRSPLHALNPGYLTRVGRHLDAAHAEELRAAVARRLGRPEPEIAAVTVSGLTPSGIDLAVLDATGARRLSVGFPRTARTPADLGDLLRTHLHDHLC